MSGGTGILALKEEDVSKFLASSTHLGTNNLNFQMESYVFKRRPDGIYLIDLRKTWEKLLVAARAIVAIKNKANVCVISSRAYGQRAVLKYASATGATPIAGRFTPGTFTNQIQAAFREPELLVVTDPRVDHQPLTEASYVNIPVIAFCNTDSPLSYVDIAIPCNNKGTHSIGLMWWMLARQVERMRGNVPHTSKWDVKVDLYFYRDPEEAEKEEQAQAQVHNERAIKETADDNFGDVPATVGDTADWSEPSPAAPSMGAFPPTQDWASAPTEEWGADTPTTPAAPAPVAAPVATNDWGSAGESWG